MIEMIKEVLRRWLGVSRPVEIVFSGEKIEWGVADSRWLRNVLANESWKKLRLIVQSNIALSALPAPGEPFDPGWLNGYVAGKVDLMGMIERYGVAEEPESTDDSAEEKVTTIQEQDDE